MTALISCAWEEQLCESDVQLLQLAIVRVLAVTPRAGNAKFITDAVDFTLAFPTWSPLLRWRAWSSSALLSALSCSAFSCWDLFSRLHCACGATKCARSRSCRWPAGGLKIYRSLLVMGVHLSVTVSTDSVVARRASMVWVTVIFISIVVMSVCIIADFTALCMTELPGPWNSARLQGEPRDWNGRGLVVPGCASQGEHRTPGDQERRERRASPCAGTQKDSSNLLHDSQGKFHWREGSTLGEAACATDRGSLARYALRSCSKVGRGRGGDSASASGTHLNDFVPRIVDEIVARIISQERVQNGTEKQIVNGPVHQITEDAAK